MPPLEILTAARDLIATRGWIQDELEDNQGRRCMVGAIHAVAGMLIGTRTMHATFAHLGQAIHRKKCPHPHFACIAVWNDTPGRTKRQVLNAFDRAIALAEVQAAIAKAKRNTYRKRNLPQEVIS